MKPAFFKYWIHCIQGFEYIRPSWHSLRVHSEYVLDLEMPEIPSSSLLQSTSRIPVQYVLSLPVISQQVLAILFFFFF